MCVCVCVCVCVQVNHLTYDIQSFSAKVSSRGYHVYHDNNWPNLVIHQPVQVSIETNAISKTYDPYCCKITITQQDRIGVVIVDHIPCKLLQSVYHFLQEGGFVTGTSASIQYQVSPIREGELEIPIQMTFSDTSKLVVEKIKLFVKFQSVKIDQVFRLEVDEENPDDVETKDIILDDDGDEELIQGTGNSGEGGTSKGPAIIVIDDEQQIVADQ